MAKKEQSDVLESVASENPAPPAEAKPAPTYTKADLIADAALLGVAPHIMAGALAFVKKDTLTRHEALTAVEAFKARPVK